MPLPLETDSLFSYLLEVLISLPNPRTFKSICHIISIISCLLICVCVCMCVHLLSSTIV